MAEARQPDGPQSDPSALDPVALDPVEFANIVRTASDAQLAHALAARRTVILDEIFTRMEEHFDPTKSADLDLVIHFNIGGQPEGDFDRYQVVIRNDTCKTGRDRTEAAALGLTLDGVDFLKLVANLITGMDLYLAGKLKIDGNMMVATRLTGLFAMPDVGGVSTTATEGQ